MAGEIGQFGAECVPGGVRFRVWAPSCAGVDLVVGDEDTVVPMRRDGEGWFDATVAGAAAGTLYGFRPNGGAAIPDPASRHQPHGVPGPSAVVDPAAFAWTDAAWRGFDWDTAVLYELHVGAFTPNGTFRAVVDRLDHLVELGVTAIELMPVADCPGRRNWGYDGVQLFAPRSSYGSPDDLRALVDACHGRGLGVVLDVVYNHLGPEGNHLGSLGPYFTDRHRTPWGAAVNLDGADSGPVRRFLAENAASWIRDFHMDGLRLDAVHALVDTSPVHVLDEIAAAARAAGKGRQVHIILENEENAASRLVPGAGPAPGRTAQWNDDVHHVLHAALTGEAEAYYGDYAGRAGMLGRALAEGFAFQGEVMAHRGRARGEPSAALPPSAFVAFLQNHDQVGNRALGERIDAIAPPEAVRAATAILLLAPQVPMLFMGEEWGATSPFLFFCDFDEPLATAVREGRRAEFGRFRAFADPAARDLIPDPVAEGTFRASVLDWAEPTRDPHGRRLGQVKALLAVRRATVAPHLSAVRHGGSWRVIGPMAVAVRWELGTIVLSVACNLSASGGVPAPAAEGRLLWTEGELTGGTLGPWTVRWTLNDQPVPGSTSLP